jgi:heme exporter protein D
MDPSNFTTGPIFYVLVAWGIVTVIFVLLLVWRSVLSSHEDDQIFLDAAQDHMAREQRELVAKINKISRPLLTSGIASGLLLLVLAGMWLYNGFKNF